MIGYASGQVFLLRSIRENDLEEFRFNIDLLIGGCWSSQGDLFLLNVEYQRDYYVYLVGAEGTLRARVAAEERICGMAFDRQDLRFFLSSEKSVCEFCLRKDYQPLSLESEQMVVLMHKDGFD